MPNYLLLLVSHFSRVQLCVTPQTAAHQAPPSLGLSRQEYWSGLPLFTIAAQNLNSHGICYKFGSFNVLYGTMLNVCSDLYNGGPRRGITRWRNSTIKKAPRYSSWHASWTLVQLDNDRAADIFQLFLLMFKFLLLCSLVRIKPTDNFTLIKNLLFVLILPWSFSSSTVAFMLNIQDSSEFLKDTLPVLCRRKFYKILLQKYLLEICNA